MSSFRIGYERSLYQAASGPPALHVHQRELAAARERLMTGLAVNRPSDDPIAYEQGRNAASMSARYETYLQSIETSRMWVDRTEQALNHMNEILAQATEEGVRAANSFRSESDLDAIASRLEGLLAELVDTMNTKQGTEFVFGGTRTGLSPFDTDGLPTADLEDLAGARTRPIGPGQPMQVNVTGEQLYQVSDDLTITGAIQEMIEAIRDRDLERISNAIGDTEEAREHIARLGTETGSKARRLTLAETSTREASLLSEAERSRHEDADMIETAVRLQRAEASLQAALQVTARSLQTSILDYLR
jgi:flagellar hook-associated protein 3 FlgL